MQLKLVKGAGSPTTGACWMSALSYYAGYEWSDYPECVDPVIVWLGQRLNDLLCDDERETVIGPHIMAPLGTHQGHRMMLLRAFVVVDRAVRVWAPRRMDAWEAWTGDPSLDRLPVIKRAKPRKSEFAARLRALPPIVDAESANLAFRTTTDLHVREATKSLWLAIRDPLGSFQSIARAVHHAVQHSEPSDLLPLILDLCAMGERTEIPQVRDLCALPQACR